MVHLDLTYFRRILRWLFVHDESLISQWNSRINSVISLAMLDPYQTFSRTARKPLKSVWWNSLRGSELQGCSADLSVVKGNNDKIWCVSTTSVSTEMRYGKIVLKFLDGSELSCCRPQSTMNTNLKNISLIFLIIQFFIFKRDEGAACCFRFLRFFFRVTYSPVWQLSRSL